MFAVEVRDYIRIAHALLDPFFGPAANKHGATFIVDVAFNPRSPSDSEQPLNANAILFLPQSAFLVR